MADDLHARNRSAHPKTAILPDDAPHVLDLLDVHQERWLDQIGFHLHDDIGTAGQNAGRADRAGKQRNGGLQRFRSLVSHALHHTPRHFLTWDGIKSNLPAQNNRLMVIPKMLYGRVVPSGMVVSSKLASSSTAS
jgi:hypothetical protein